MKMTFFSEKYETTTTHFSHQLQEEQEVRVSQLFNTLLFTQQQQEQQEVRVSQLFNTLLFTQQQQEEQEVRVSQLFNTLLFIQQEVTEFTQQRCHQMCSQWHWTPSTRPRNT